MNKKPATFTLALGLLFALITLAFALDLDGLATALPLGAQAAFGLGGCSVALIACGVFALAHKPTPIQLIEQTDERNIAIGNQAATKAFNLFSILIPVVALALWVFGQLSMPGVLVFIGVEVVAFIAYVFFIARAQKTM